MLACSPSPYLLGGSVVSIGQQQAVASLEQDAGDDQHDPAAAGRSATRGQAEIIHQHEARPLALRWPQFIPIIASVLGLLDSFRMMGAPDPVSPQRRARPG
jgi:hypothetical protein